MKKLIALVSLITCVFGLTACGSEEVYTEYEQSKLDTAQQRAVQYVIPNLSMFIMNDENADFLDEYTAAEIEYLVAQNLNFSTDGYAFMSAVESFHSAKEEMGSIVNIGSAEAEFDDSQIIVYVQVEGEKKNAEAEIIFTNDMFMTLESASLNPVSSMGQLMSKAALNTVIGMGTVFIVLILISLIISCFGIIPKLQAKFSKKDTQAKASGVDNAVAQITTQEEIVDESDDLELVAVIAAAIAASEGAASTDGFVVRSIRKVNRARR